MYVYSTELAWSVDTSYLNNYLHFQTMSELKGLLSASGIEFQEFEFETDIGIEKNPFILVCFGNIRLLLLWS